MYSVFLYQKNELQPVPSIAEALGIDPKQCPVVSLTGGGGKTTTIHRMTRELMEMQEKVIVTTTTHMKEEEAPWFCTRPEWDAVTAVLEQYGQVWAGIPHPGGKIASLPEELMKRLLDLKLPVLIEADGARRLPVKCPAGHEPVIRPETTHVINVYGLDAVGKPLEEICFRPELAAALLGRTKQQMADPITEDDIVRLALSPEAGRKCSEGHMHHTILLNKADIPGGMDKALTICRKITGLADADRSDTAESEELHEMHRQTDQACQTGRPEQRKEAGIQILVVAD